MNTTLITTSLIGSFRKYFYEIREIMDQLQLAGIKVLSPKPSDVLDPNVEFVILSSDNPLHTEEEIELVALNRILRSSFVYTYNPGGYVGRTTCYEIGHILQRRVPIYFLEKPKDLPILIPSNSIWSIDELVDYVNRKGVIPKYDWSGVSDFGLKLRDDLLECTHINDD